MLMQIIYELAAGKLSPGEDPEHCARRELEEETGYTAARYEKLIAFYTSPGFCTEKLHIYLATGLSRAAGGQKLEEGEASISTVTLPLKQALDMIASEEIVDGKTIVGLYMAAMNLK